MKIEHPAYPNRPIGSLLWRRNPFTESWEYWNMNFGHWYSGFVPKLYFNDKIVSYRETWCDPIPVTEND